MSKKEAVAANEAVAVELATKKKSAIIMSLAEVNKLAEREGLKTKAAIIRYFAAQGYDRMSIAKTLNIRYQHVRNTLVENEKNT